jgi:hypothetical protein
MQEGYVWDLTQQQRATDYMRGEHSHQEQPEQPAMPVTPELRRNGDEVIAVNSGVLTELADGTQ